MGIVRTAGAWRGLLPSAESQVARARARGLEDWHERAGRVVCVLSFLGPMFLDLAETAAFNESCSAI